MQLEVGQSCQIWLPSYGVRQCGAVWFSSFGRIGRVAEIAGCWLNESRSSYSSSSSASEDPGAEHGRMRAVAETMFLFGDLIKNSCKPNPTHIKSL